MRTTKENHEKLMFCKRHNDYGSGSFQYDNSLTKEKHISYKTNSEIANKYEKELPEDLVWYLKQRNSLFPRKFNIVK